MINKRELAAVWKRLAETAKRKKTIQYSHLAELSGLVESRNKPYAGRKPSLHLHEIQNFCSDNELPPLTVLAHNWKGVRGKGYAADPKKSINQEIGEVWAVDWEQIGNPYKKGGKNSLKVRIDTLNDTDKQKKLQFAKRPYREQQPAFRQGLLDIYNGCAFCEIKIPSVLDAAHIRPWSKCENDLDKIDLNNGMILCKNHHYAFDAGLIWITKDFEIRTSSCEVRNQLKVASKLVLPDKVDRNKVGAFLDYHRRNKPKLT